MRNSKLKMGDLYHFTCNHGKAGIDKTNILLPNIHPYMPCMGPLIWLTDIPEPTRESAGLTMNWTKCDRMAYRYIVRSRAAVSWLDIRHRAPKEVVVTLESFGQPEHWWVTRRPLTSSEFSFDETWMHVESEVSNHA